MQPLEGRHVLVTGANGGLGEQFVAQALERGAAKVYAAARSPRDWDDPRVESLDLDLNDPDAPARAAAAASDVDLLINNAAIAPAGDSISGRRTSCAGSSRRTSSGRCGSATPSRRCSRPTAAAPCQHPVRRRLGQHADRLRRLESRDVVGDERAAHPAARAGDPRDRPARRHDRHPDDSGVGRPQGHRRRASSRRRTTRSATARSRSWPTSHPRPEVPAEHPGRGALPLAGRADRGALVLSPVPRDQRPATNRAWTRVSAVASGWNDVASSGPCRTATGWPGRGGQHLDAARRPARPRARG